MPPLHNRPKRMNIPTPNYGLLLILINRLRLINVTINLTGNHIRLNHRVINVMTIMKLQRRRLHILPRGFLLPIMWSIHARNVGVNNITLIRRTLSRPHVHLPRPWSLRLTIGPIIKPRLIDHFSYFAGDRVCAFPL